MTAETLFTDDEKAAIAEAIEQVERTTAGEIAVMVVDQSDRYPEAAVVCGVIFGSSAALILTHLLFYDSLQAFIPLGVPLVFVFALLAGYLPFLKRLFLLPARLEDRVRERAVRAFYEEGLYKTRDRTGVLLFISLFERKVWVLADEGINERITPDELQAYAAGIARGIKEKNGAKALCEAIRAVGDVLAVHFPIKEDDANELANELRTG